jgi:predicted metal-binding membrane protein
MHRYTDQHGIQMVLDRVDDDRDRLAGIRSVAALTTVGLGAVAWVIAFQPMTGMDTMRVIGPGSFASFISLWVLMLAAMMLPGTAPAVFRYASGSGASVRGILLFVGSYLAVWTLVGVALYAVGPVYQPHGSVTAGAIAIAAGVYELTPLKQQFRQRCSAENSPRSGVELGLACVGSSIGLMLVQVALGGGMSVAWMSAVGLVMLAQKVLPGNAVLDVPLALAIVGLGLLIVLAPASVPGFMASL